MLETIHEYAAERLAQSGEDAALRERHAEYYLALVRRFDRADGAERFDEARRLEREKANVRAARVWLSDTRPAYALELAIPHHALWMSRDEIAEQRRVLEDALLRAPDASPSLRSRGFTVAGRLSAIAGDGRAAALYDEGLAIAERSGCDRDIAFAQLAAGRYAEALTLFHRLGDDRGSVRALHRLGEDAIDDGDLPRARELLDRSVALARSYADPSLLEPVLHRRGDCALLEGGLDEASRLYRESLDLALRVDALWGMEACLAGLAVVEAHRGKLASAGRLWQAAQAQLRRNGDSALSERMWSRYEAALAGVPLPAPVADAASADVVAAAVAYARTL
jgi:tetratricopeptide (TPR) repeat protein